MSRRGGLDWTLREIGFQGYLAGQLWDEHLCLRQDKEGTRNASVLRTQPDDRGDLQLLVTLLPSPQTHAGGIPISHSCRKTLLLHSWQVWEMVWALSMQTSMALSTPMGAADSTHALGDPNIHLT